MKEGVKKKRGRPRKHALASGKKRSERRPKGMQYTYVLRWHADTKTWVLRCRELRTEMHYRGGRDALKKDDALVNEIVRFSHHTFADLKRRQGEQYPVPKLKL